jgi:hypothetical protein
MSMKNDFLLFRSGRNQFGDSGENVLPRYTPSPEVSARDELLREEHRRLNEQFLLRHRERWLSMFTGKKTLKSAWGFAFPHGRPSYSTFCKECREFDTTEEYFCFLLISHKRWGLRIMGFTEEEMDSELKVFEECGRHFVSYGKSSRTFSSAI